MSESWTLHLNIGNTDARELGSMAFCPAILLAALLLEHANLPALFVAVDHRQHLGARDERRAGHELARILADEEHLVEGQLGAGLVAMAGDFDDGTRLNADLASACLNDGKHSRFSAGNPNF